MNSVTSTFRLLQVLLPLLFSAGFASAESWERLLLQSAQSGDIQAAQNALMHGALPNYQETTTGEIPLLRAVRQQDAKMVELLLKFGADPNVTNKRGERPLPMVLDFPDLRIASLLIRGGAYVPNTEIDGKNILLETVRRGKFSLARLMVEHGSGDVRLRDAQGNNLAAVAILFAMEFPYKEQEAAEFITWLRTRFALSMEENNSEGKSPLDLALSSGRQPIALAVDWKRLHQATIAAMTPLTSEERLALAVQKSDMETVRAQVANANLKVVEEQLGISLLALAIESDQRDLLSLLIKHGADLNRANQEGLTPLLLAMQKNNQVAATLLVQAGAKADQIGENGASPLFLACAGGKAEFVRLFVNAGADLKITNRSGTTSLMCVVHSGDVDLATFLLQNGADPLAVNTKGLTAADIAAAAGEIGMVRLLDRQGKHSALIAEFTPAPTDPYLGKWDATGEFSGQLALEFSPDGTGKFIAGRDQGRMVWKTKPDFSVDLWVRLGDEKIMLEVRYDYATGEILLDNGGTQVRLAKQSDGPVEIREQVSPASKLRVDTSGPDPGERSAEGLDSIPMDLFERPTSIRSLDLSFNRLELIDGIQAFKELEKLNLRNNRIVALPEEIGALLKLHTLDLSDNRLTLLPDNIAGLAKLKSLNLSHNGLQGLPSSLWRCNILESLDLSSNHLTEFPIVALELTGLRTLSLANNGLYEIPRQIMRLTRLKELDLRFNRISELPSELGRMTNLKLLRLTGNPLSEEQQKKIRKQFPRLALQFDETSIAAPTATPPPFTIKGKKGIPPALPLLSTEQEAAPVAAPTN